jgi:multisubunit Na+/H+ antiporter MnhB subunit
MQAGCVLTLVGIAELTVHGYEQYYDTREFLMISGAIALAIGLGFLISSGASFFLSRSWGLLTSLSK